MQAIAFMLLLVVCTGACATKSYHGMWAPNQFLDRSSTIHIMENPHAKASTLEEELISTLSKLIESQGFRLTESAEIAKYYVFLGYGTRAGEGDTWLHGVVVEVVDAERFRKLRAEQKEEYYILLSRYFSSANDALGKRPGRGNVVVWRTSESLHDRAKDPARPLRKMHQLVTRAVDNFGAGRSQQGGSSRN